MSHVTETSRISGVVYHPKFKTSGVGRVLNFANQLTRVIQIRIFCAIDLAGYLFSVFFSLHVM